MEKEALIMIAGFRGMVGSALYRFLKKKGFTNLLPIGREHVDLTKQDDTLQFFKNVKPDYVLDAAAKVGGIIANKTYQMSHFFKNACQLNCISA